VMPPSSTIALPPDTAKTCIGPSGRGLSRATGRSDQHGVRPTSGRLRGSRRADPRCARTPRARTPTVHDDRRSRSFIRAVPYEVPSAAEAEPGVRSSSILTMCTA
jgi:hypothetical protein